MLQVIQGHIKKSYESIEPYAMPVGIAGGTALIIHQLWGAVAACSFVAATSVIGAAFPHIITELTKEDLALGGLRIVLMATLPFFGTWGIIASVCLATVSSFTQDIRLYTIRSEIKRNIELAEEIKATREDLIAKRESMVRECNQKLEEAKAFWSREPIADQIKASIKEYGTLVDQNTGFLQNLSQNVQAHGLLEEIESVKAMVLALAKEAKDAHK